MGTNVIFTVNFPGATKNGITFTEELTAPSGTLANPGVVKKTFDLSGYKLDLRGTSGNSYNKLQTSFTVKSDPNGPTVVVTNQQSTVINATFRNATFYYARGYFGNQILQDTSNTEIDFLKKIKSGTLDISNANVKFIIKNGIKAPAKSNLIFASNTNSGGNQVFLTHPQIGNFIPVNPANVTYSSFAESETVYEFNTINSNIEEFIENLGHVLDFAYKIELNPNGNDSGGWNEVFEQSRVSLQVQINMPFALGLNDLVLADTFDLSLAQNSNFAKVSSGQLEIDAVNAFPLSGHLEIRFLSENGDLLGTTSTSEQIQSSVYGSETVNGLNVKRSKIMVDIPESLVKSFDEVDRIELRSVFNTINPGTNTSEQMIIPAGAFLGLKIKANFKLNTEI